MRSTPIVTTYLDCYTAKPLAVIKADMRHVTFDKVEIGGKPYQLHDPHTIIRRGVAIRTWVCTSLVARKKRRR